MRGTPFPWAAYTPRIPKSVSSKAWRAHWLLSGPGKEKETEPGNRARRWGTLENKVPEDKVAGLISGPRKSSMPLGIAKNKVPEEGEEAIFPNGPRIPPRAYPPTLLQHYRFAIFRGTWPYIYIHTRVDPCIKCTRSKLDTGQGVLGLVAPEDLLSACCLVLPLLLSPLVLSPLAWSPWGSRASPGALLGPSWTSPGPLLGRSMGFSWVAPGCSS